MPSLHFSPTPPDSFYHSVGCGFSRGGSIRGQLWFTSLGRFWLSLLYSLHTFYPDKYNIEIFNDVTYEDVLARDLALFKSGKNPISYNNMIKVYNYREIGQRDAQQVYEDTVEQIHKTKKIMDGKLMQEAMKYVQQGILKMSDLQGIKRI